LNGSIYQEINVMAIGTERVLAVRHWTETQFTFTTTRDPGLRFENGQFLVLGLAVGIRPLLRAYSIASANHEETLEFLSIKIKDGPLTSRLQSLRAGDTIIMSRKPTGTLVLRDLRPGKRLYLLSTGTGAAPFLSLIKDPSVYERFERVIIVHGVRFTREGSVVSHQILSLATDAHLGKQVCEQLQYYPCVTREPHINRGRITTMIETGQLSRDLDLPPLNPSTDRVMVCGSPAMLKDIGQLLDARGFAISPGIGEPGDYVIERAFVNHPHIKPTLHSDDPSVTWGD
jgi:ferredoxin--NADP+ reductase